MITSSRSSRRVSRAAAVYITDVGDTRWLKVNVIDSPTGGTGSTSGKPLQEKIILHPKLNHNWRLRRLRSNELALQQVPVEPLSLADRARKTVENASFGAIGLSQPFGHHVAHQPVGNQFTPVHRLLGFAAQLGTPRDVVAQQIAGRNLRNTQYLGDPFCLRSLARAGSPDQDDCPCWSLQHSLPYPSPVIPCSASIP